MSGRHWLTFRHWLRLRLRKRVIRPVCSRLYRDTDRDIRRSILVAGTGRSGTTWLADILGHLLRSRTMFEPFNSRMVTMFGAFHYFHYARPSEDDERLLEYCRTVFSGGIRHRWIDRGVTRLRPRSRVIKEIRANLFLAWIRERFPEIPILFLIRHPCAVVLSRIECDWATDSDLAPFLAQEKLVDDHLRDHVERIRSLATEEEKHAAVWCVSNLVPLRQFAGDELDVVFYEHLCDRPEREIERIRNLLARWPFGEGLEDSDRALRRIDLPSTTTTRASAVRTGGDRLARWRRSLSAEQVGRILSVVEAFGLDYLYGDSDTPIADPRDGATP